MRPILVTGAGGMLGVNVLTQGWALNLPMVGISKQMCDITHVSQVRALVGHYVDPIIINCAGIVRGRATEGMENVNGRGPHILQQFTTRLVQVSTDCVFRGDIEDGQGYDESDPPDPSDEYGRTKTMGEVKDNRHVVTVRGSFIGFGERGLVKWLTGRQRASTVRGFTDQAWNGMTVSVFARELLAISQLNLGGVVHLVGPEEMTKFELVRALNCYLQLGLEVTEAEGGRRRMVLRNDRMEPIPDTWDDMLCDLAAAYDAVPILSPERSS